MQLSEVAILAKQFHPKISVAYFIPRRHFMQLYYELRMKGHKWPNLAKIPSSVKLDNLTIWNAKTDDPAIVREANRLSNEEYQKALQARQASGGLGTTLR